MPLLLGGLPGVAETLMLISIPDTSGVVHVRRWTADDWSATPQVIAERAAVLLAALEKESARGRTMNQSLYSLRLWLRGEGSGAR